MARSHHFHVDLGDHSVTVNVGSGRGGEVELLVNGKVVGYIRERRGGLNVLTGELPDEPVRPFRVLVRQPRLLPSPVRCTLELDGVQRPLPQRPVV